MTSKEHAPLDAFVRRLAKVRDERASEANALIRPDADRYQAGVAEGIAIALTSVYNSLENVNSDVNEDRASNIAAKVLWMSAANETVDMLIEMVESNRFEMTGRTYVTMRDSLQTIKNKLKET